MKILFFGDYSNVHNTLADGMRKMGHVVNVASDGDSWKNYKRDIDISYQSKLKFLLFILQMFFDKRFRNNDVVQLISYRFLFKNKLGFLNKYVFNFLKRNNKKIVLCAFGEDYFVVDAYRNKKIEYSQITHLNPELPYMKEIFDVHYSDVAKNLNRYIADNCNGIVSCMYDYYVGYNDLYSDKLINIPLPIDLEKTNYTENIIKDKINIFFGFQKHRRDWKGSDIIWNVLKDIESEYPDRFNVKIVESVPFTEYIKLFSEANLFFDQTYGYGQGMNGLLAMASGKVLFGGGEPENYKLINESENFPVINITTDIVDMKKKILFFLEKPAVSLEIGKNSREYVRKHHDSAKIAKKYLEFYQKI